MTGLRSRDWTRPWGIPFDRSQCPPDDEQADIAAWLAGRFDTLAADQFTLDHQRSGDDT